VISFVIPAHNEEALIGATLHSITEAAAQTIGTTEPYEIVVVDDASTDRTAEIARTAGARVVAANVRQIAAARNTGARAARGDRLVFVDADTLLPAATLRAALRALDGGAVGGGAGFEGDPGPLPLWGPPVLAIVAWIMRTARWAAGCFLFVRRDAFERAGGFDERYFASEEIHLSRALKRLGRFVILREAVITSNRKARLFTGREILWQFVSAVRPSTLKNRHRLPMWYGGHRERSENE
jgi:glycosyltransferase involved in cell wall biosynthesis